jgi:beta-lactamase superfamily II metal-dependent hydrolase
MANEWLNDWVIFLTDSTGPVAQLATQVSQQILVADQWNVVHRLILNQQQPGSPEGLLRTLGWVHVYGSSGIHIYALADCVAFIMQRIAIFNPRFTQWLKWIVMLIVFLLFILLWSLQGFRFGFLRPLFLIGIRWWAQAQGMQFRWWAPLTITGIMDSVLGVPGGRMHYYLCVGGGLAAGHWWKQNQYPRSTWIQHAVMALGSWVFIALVEMIEYHQVSLMTPLISLLSIPILCTVLYPLLVLTLGWGVLTGQWVGMVTVTEWIQSFLQTSIQVLDYFAVTFLWFSESSLFYAAGISFAVILGWSFFAFKNPGRVFAFICVLGLLIRAGIGWMPQSHPQQNLFQWDVGQGDALAYQFNDRIEWIDVGSKRTFRPERRLQQWTKHGVDHADAILLTHLDEDHTGSLARVAAILPMGCVQTHPHHWNSKKGKVLKNKVMLVQPKVMITTQNCIQTIDVAWFQTKKSIHGNNLMAGSVIQLSDHELYLGLGDGDHAQEKLYLHHYKNRISQAQMKIWKIGHHGSRHSSSLDFLKELNPSEVWLSVGRKNSYHHPHPTVMDHLAILKLKVLRTDRQGTLVWSNQKPSNHFLPKLW